jgi:hypothetical protein
MVCIVRDEHNIMAEAQTLSTINYIIIHVQRKSTNIYHRQKLPSVSHHMARHAAAPIIASVYTKRKSKRSSSINIPHYGAKNNMLIIYCFRDTVGKGYCIERTSFFLTYIASSVIKNIVLFYVPLNHHNHKHISTKLVPYFHFILTCL